MFYIFYHLHNLAILRSLLHLQVKLNKIHVGLHVQVLGHIFQKNRNNKLIKNKILLLYIHSFPTLLNYGIIYLCIY